MTNEKNKGVKAIPGIATGPEVSCEIKGFVMRQEVPPIVDPFTAAKNQLTELYNNEPREVIYARMVVAKLRQDLQNDCLDRAGL